VGIVVVLPQTHRSLQTMGTLAVKALGLVLRSLKKLRLQVLLQAKMVVLVLEMADRPLYLLPRMLEDVES
jgi:hypothetical protein